MEEFEAALAELAALEEGRRALRARGEDGIPSHPLNVAYREALLEDWQQANPKKKAPKNIEKALADAPNLEAIKADHGGRAEKWVEETINAPMREVKDRLEHLAAGLDIPKSDEWVQIADVWASTYRGQGYGAAKYAEGSARQTADKAEFYGLETLVERVERFPSSTGAGCSFIVRAKTTPTGAAILARKPDVPLKDWLIACRARGVNPRVYAPFMPYGVEEELRV